VGVVSALIWLAVVWFGANTLREARSLPLSALPHRHSCDRPEPGSAVQEPQDMSSQDGVLQVDLIIQNQKQPDGSTRYCYLTLDGTASPTLRLKPGDLLILRFKNDLIDLGSNPPIDDASGRALLAGPICVSKASSDPCASGAMTATSSNLHFHGLTVPPLCHQDDVLKTSIQPED